MRTPTTHRIASWSVITLSLMPTYLLAATTPLAQFPPGSASRDPAPNVIITVDDSGSMGGSVKGGTITATNPQKMALLKNSLRAAFNSARIPDDRIRLAWQSMWGCTGFPGARQTRNGNNPYFNGCVGDNTMKPFSGQHRTDFEGFIQNLGLANTTPSHAVVYQAGYYLQAPKGINSPWASNPGVTELPYLECRKAYHIFLTDGAWNDLGGGADTNCNTGDDNNKKCDGTEIANVDGTDQTLPDGTVYDAFSSQTYAYSDIYPNGSTRETLSDLAFYFWATDLQPDIPNGPNTPASSGTSEIKKGVQPLIRKSGTEVISSFDKSASTSLEEYWNPKNDPATWQHITQYTIGFGTGSTSWAGNPKWDQNPLSATYDNNYNTISGGYTDLVNNKVTWQNVIAGSARESELWHMALNGRGKYFPARDADSLTKAFNEILDNIKADTSRPLVSIATSATSLRNGGTVYLAGYDANNWSGKIEAKSATSLGAINSTAIWSTATILDDNNNPASNPSTRAILSHNGTAPIEFQYNNLSTDQKAVFNNVGGLAGERSVNYIRGVHDDEKTPETPANVSGPFRDRTKIENGVISKTRQGDIVNSNIWFVGRPGGGYNIPTYTAYSNANAGRKPMIYVGGNDGMLHGFEAATTGTGGTERLAYIPKGVIANLPKLTATTYGDNSNGSNTTHLYYVDGSPFAGDLIVGGGWKTYLVGTLGAGGKGYFILDVTDPSGFSSTNLSTVVADRTFAANDTTADPDIGFMFGDAYLDAAFAQRAPQFSQLQSGTWALFMGNGYNSTNGQAKLIVHSANGSITSINTDGSTNNGLSTPTPIDLNGDNKVDVVYAGDIQGNLWKFDFTAGIPTTGTLVFTTANNRPITVAPEWFPHPDGGIMLAFGTGQNLTPADSSDTTTQYKLYGIRDAGLITNLSDGTVQLSNAPAFAGDDDLVQRSFSGGTGNLRDLPGSTPIDYQSQKGWYVNLPRGERMLRNPLSFSASLIVMPTTVPASGSNTVGETCETTTNSGESWLNFVDMINGLQPQVATIDTNNDGVIDSSDGLHSGLRSNGESIIVSTSNNRKVVVGIDNPSSNNPNSSGTKNTLLNDPPPALVTGGWRQMQ